MNEHESMAVWFSKASKQPSVRVAEENRNHVQESRAKASLEQSFFPISFLAGANYMGSTFLSSLFFLTVETAHQELYCCYCFMKGLSI